MSSALKPVLNAGGPQTTSVSPQISKPVHQQVSTTTYNQNTAHMPQNLVNLTHGPTNPANLHHHGIHPTPNHYSLNVPNASQHYGNIPTSSHPAPINISQSVSQYSSSPPKNSAYSSAYQPNLGHPPNVSQPSIPQSHPPQATAPAPEMPQSNGTSEIASIQNHSSPTPENLSQAPDDSNSPEKPSTPVQSSSDEASNDSKQQEQTVPEPSSSAVAPIADSSYPEEPRSVADQNNEVESVPDNSGDEGNIDMAENESENKDDMEETKELTSAIAPAETSTSSLKHKEQIVTPKSTMRLATTPRTPSRKVKTPKTGDISDSPKSSKVDRVLTSQKSPPSTKRTRTKTQPYQSPLPELEIISKLSTSTSTKHKSGDDRLIIFYKNEFLAVRNSEGSFYICQAMQNIYKSSPKIRIRWLSVDKNDKSGEIYTPDFYDHTDFDCILTNLNLERKDKGKFRLPPAEKERTDSILKRALAVEKGDATPPSLTEEHPDGLDLSLYKEESQIQKRKAQKRKASGPLKMDKKPTDTKKTPEQPKVKKVSPKPKQKPNKKSSPKKLTPVESKKLTAISPSTPTSNNTPSRSERAKRRQVMVKKSPVVDQKKAKVLAKVARKSAVSISTTKASPMPSSKPNTKSASKVTPPSTQSNKKASTRQQPVSATTEQRKTKRTRK